MIVNDRYNLHNNDQHIMDHSLFVTESQQMWLDWLETEHGQHYVDMLFDIPKKQLIIKKAERFFKKLEKEQIKRKLSEFLSEFL